MPASRRKMGEAEREWASPGKIKTGVKQGLLRWTRSAETLICTHSCRGVIIERSYIAWICYGAGSAYILSLFRMWVC